MVPSAEEEITLAIRIEEAEHELVGVLLRSAAVILKRLRKSTDTQKLVVFLDGVSQPGDVVAGTQAPLVASKHPQAVGER